MRTGLVVVAILALIGYVAVAFVLPQMAGAEARDAALALIGGADAARQQVAAAAEKAGKVAGAGANVKIAEKNDPKHGKLTWVVSADGAIRGWNEQNALEIALTPALQGGKTAWNCKGYPVSAMPAACGGR